MHQERVQLVQKALSKELTSSINHEIQIEEPKIDQSQDYFNRVYKHQIPLRLYQTNYSQKVRNFQAKSR